MEQHGKVQGTAALDQVGLSERGVATDAAEAEVRWLMASWDLKELVIAPSHQDVCCCELITEIIYLVPLISQIHCFKSCCRSGEVTACWLVKCAYVLISRLVTCHDDSSDRSECILFLP